MLLGNNIRYSRSKKTILENINISAVPGKILFIKGDNGSGKTTLLKILVNILSPDEGDIFWIGKKIAKNIFNFYNSTTLILDKPTATSGLTIKENVNFWKKISLSQIKKKEIIKLLEVLELDKFLNKKSMYLSQGEIKKLELTRLIIEQKKLWVLDEPYNGLDDKTITLINDTFIDHVSNDGIIIFASHYEPDIRNLEILTLDKL